MERTGSVRLTALVNSAVSRVRLQRYSQNCQIARYRQEWSRNCSPHSWFKFFPVSQELYQAKLYGKATLTSSA